MDEKRAEEIMEQGLKAMGQNRAAQVMAQGYAWSEAVLQAVCQEFEMEHDFVSKGIATLFAGGMGNTGSVCGAVVGALMGIGLKIGRTDNMEEMLRTYAVAAEFRRRFEAEMETINCRELTGLDLSTEDGLKKLMESDIPQTVCFPAVGIAYKLAVNLLKENS